MVAVSVSTGLRPFENVPNHFENVRPSGSSWTARCPAHDDRRNSLSISEGVDGRVLLKCHAGCSTEAVMASANPPLAWADLFADSRDENPVIVSTYSYTDESGELLFEAVRYYPKDFRQRRPDGRGGWEWNLNGVRRVLYRLPEVVEAAQAGRHVLVAEGESDVERLRARGFAATCNPMGAGNWRDDYAEALRGGKVAVLTDNDEPGRAHAQQVAAKIHNCGIDVKVIELPGLPDKGDVSDWLNRGGTAEELREIVRATEPWTPGPKDASTIVAGPRANTPTPPAWPNPLAPEAFHGLAGEVVRTIEPTSEADPVGLLANFLSAFGSAAGAGPHVVAGDVQHPARLNVLIVGRTARSRKGTSWAPIGRVMAIADETWASTRMVSGLASGEGLIAAVAGLEGPDVSSDSRLFAYESEFSRVLRVASRDGATLTAILRQSFDTGNLAVLTRKDPLRAKGAHITVLAHITIEELRARLSETDIANGFANRFLVMLVDRSKKLADGGSLDTATAGELGRKVATALKRARKIGEMRRSPEAAQLWAAIYDEIEDDEDGLLGAITARADAIMTRLQVCYALLDGIDVIGPAHVKAAAAVWDRSEESARYIFGAALGDPTADRLLAAIRAAGAAGLNFTDQSAVFARNKSAAQIERARSLLERRDSIHTIEIPSEGSRGRPSEVSIASEHYEENEFDEKSQVEGEGR